MVSFDETFNKYRLLVEKHLPEAYPEIRGEHHLISEASRYSLLAGGKRIRPILCFAIAEMVHLNRAEVIPFACGAEMIHTYSLIHDDLPCMDNDDYRRGKQTCHKVYGEAIALLAGDALLNKAYENMARACLNHPSEGKLAAMQYLAEAAGDNGMIGGQVLDLQSENQQISLELLKQMHSMKTGAMIRACVMIPVLIAEKTGLEFGLLEQYASDIGIAFQIRDDILDVTATSGQLGKTAGKDSVSKKSTYVSLLGLESAKASLIEAHDNALNHLTKLQTIGYTIDFLRELTYYLLERNN